MHRIMNNCHHQHCFKNDDCKIVIISIITHKIIESSSAYVVSLGLHNFNRKSNGKFDIA